ncbi:unnamed protein product, partial [Polarella glacialis]
DSDARVSTSALSQCDRVFTDLGHLLGPRTQESLGFSLWGRQAAMVRVPLVSESEERLLRPGPMSESHYDDSGKVFAHLNFLDRRRLCAIFLVESEG